MSKRHRKSKDMLSLSGMGADDFMAYDADVFMAPRGKKPKGKQRRQSPKRAYYDD